MTQNQLLSAWRYCKELYGQTFVHTNTNRTIGYTDIDYTKRNDPMKAHYYDLSIRVLIYRESSKFVAHALDLDILGYGDTENAAKKKLEGLVNNQLSFAACMGSPESVNFAAPKEFFNRWEKAHQAVKKLF